MASRVLYFPYISVPETAWFTRVLLYWEQVGSIVPSPYAEDLGRVSPFMRELVRAELVRPVVPAEFEGNLFGAMDSFLRFVDSDPEIARRSRPGAADVGPYARIHPEKLGKRRAGTVFEIHGEKLGHVIGNELVARGLARPAEGSNWFEVESRTARAYMAHLAAALGSLDDVNMDPITDDEVHLSPFTTGGHPGVTTQGGALGEIRFQVLDRVLPGPAEPLSVAELVAFRDNFGDRLGAFRRLIEEKILDLALVDNDEIRAAKLELFTEQIEDELSDLVARMNERGWPRLVFGALCGVVSAAIPVVASAATGAVPVAVAGVPGLAGAIYSAHSVVQGRSDYLQHPLAYAALARERLTG